MSIYFEKAQELGNLILESEASKAVADANAAFNASEEAVARMNEYRTFYTHVQQGMQSQSMSQEEVQEASQKLSEMATELKQDPIIGALVFAENEFNGFVNQVMEVLKSTITGQPLNQGGCGGCSGCDSGEGCPSCGE